VRVTQGLDDADPVAVAQEQGIVASAGRVTTGRPMNLVNPPVRQEASRVGSEAVRHAHVVQPTQRLPHARSSSDLLSAPESRRDNGENLGCVA
jgi:hypothetical protein